MNSESSQRALKAAVFGYGKMGQHHKTAIGLTANTTVVAVSDPMINSAVKNALAAEGIAHFDTPEQLLEEIKPDVVHVCTPPGSHAQLAQLALEAGSHVYVEKPFAPTVQDAKSIIETAARVGRKVCAGHQVLFEETAQRLPSLIRPLGNLVHIESYFSFNQVRRNLSPADQLMDILPHPAYLLLDVLNRSGSGDLSIQEPIVDAAGEVRCLLQHGRTTGMLTVTLRGRPVESYLKIVGDNGTIVADFVRNTIARLPGPGASAFDAIINPYWLSKQLAVDTTKAFVKRAVKKQKSYPGLFELVQAFHDAVGRNTPSPVSPESILQTVALCEGVGSKLMAAHAASEKAAKQAIEQRPETTGILNSDRKRILVTGGTGFLGTKVVQQIVGQGNPVRVLTRSLPLYAQRIPGAEYLSCDLSQAIAPEIMDHVDMVVHCAAETSGGQEEHQKNSIDATRNLIKAAARAGVAKFIFISSIAVLKSSRAAGKPLNEDASVDYDNLGRGPYVWGKAESERLCREFAQALPMDIKIIRPGPLVDFQDFTAPGRLGRKIGPIFVAVGSKKSDLAVCDVTNAARIISHYVTDYDAMPAVFNMLDPQVPQRRALADQLLKQNPYLSFFWIPQFVLQSLSPVLVALQKIIRPRKKAIRIAEAFASEHYDTALAREIHARMASQKSDGAQ